MTLNCVFFKKNEIYQALSFIGKLPSDYGLLSRTKFNIDDLYLNIKQCILILHNLVLLLLKKKLYLVKSRL